MAKYHVAWSPGVGNLKDTFKIVWDGDEPNIPKIELVVNEVPDDSDDAGAKSTEVIRFTGEVKAKTLTVADAKPNDALAKAREEITIVCGGKTQAGVKLPGVDRENGMFELQVEVRVDGKKVADSTTAYVRYEAFSPRPTGVKGPIVAFITGTDGFSEVAVLFWKKHADTVISQDGMSLAEIVNWLRSHRERYGTYGEVDITTHGNERSLAIRLFSEAGDPRKLNLTHLTKRLSLDAKPPPVDPAFALPNGLGATSRVVFRACNTGNHPDLVAAIRKHIFADVCPVYIPKYLQAYRDDGGAEFFFEQLRYFSPTWESAAAQEAKQKAIFVARYPTAKWDVEKGTFTNKAHPDQTFSLHVGPVLESRLHSDLDKPTKLSNAEIDKIADDEWTAKGYDQLDETFNTKFTDWGVVTRTQQLNPSDPKNSQFWIEVPSGASNHAVLLVPKEGGTLEIGKSPGMDIQLKGSLVEDHHATLKLAKEFHFEIDAIGGDVTVTDAYTSFSQTIAKGMGYRGTLGDGPGFTFTIGSVKLTVRGERPITLSYDLVRHQYDRRRTLRDGSPYADAHDVVPVVTNPDHYTKK